MAMRIKHKVVYDKYLIPQCCYEDAVIQTPVTCDKRVQPKCIIQGCPHCKTQMLKVPRRRK